MIHIYDYIELGSKYCGVLARTALLHLPLQPPPHPVDGAEAGQYFDYLHRASEAKEGEIK
jgi:hypothetical protein